MCLTALGGCAHSASSARSTSLAGVELHLISLHHPFRPNPQARSFMWAEKTHARTAPSPYNLHATHPPPPPLTRRHAQEYDEPAPGTLPTTAACRWEDSGHGVVG